MPLFSTPPRPVKKLVDCLQTSDLPSIQEKLVHRPEPVYWRSATCTTLQQVLSKQECDAIIERAEAVGFERALLNVGHGRQIYHPGTRHSDRCIIDDTQFAAAIFDRIKDFIPSEFRLPHSTKANAVVGLNERMRILKYEPGHYFKPHQDGIFERPDGSQTSRCTVMIYLNGDYQGGHTHIYSDDGDTSEPVTAEPGLVFVFDHRLIHESPPLQSGVKYANRTDLMFSNHD